MQAAPKHQRRFEEKLTHGRPLTLNPKHDAVVENRTLFPSTRVSPGTRLLKSGVNSRKIGARVTKGAWAGFPIFTLTLEERATCPRSCEQYTSCYGNHMQFAQRQPHGRAMEEQLEHELAALQIKNPKGFVVRLHVLGDFYDEIYVRRWLVWLEKFKALHVFGYTARRRDSSIGRELRYVALQGAERWQIRWSAESGSMSAGVIKYEARGRVEDGIVCPAQTGDTECCATCALCWSTKDRILFMEH